MRPFEEKNIKATCPVCGNVFTKKAWNQKFCCDKCKRLANISDERKRRHPRIKWNN